MSHLPMAELTPVEPDPYPWLLTCVVCGDEYKLFSDEEVATSRDIMLLACMHSWCKDCIGRGFDVAMQEYPYRLPTCCEEPLSLEYVGHMLTPDRIRQYTDKMAEFSLTDRVWCAVRTCSTFIPRQLVHGRLASCPKCQSLTCIECKDVAHEGTCPPNQENIDIGNLARDAGWQKCARCQEWRERSDGCNHMTCPYPCRGEFCYRCGAIWKTCQCSQFDHPGVRAVEVGWFHDGGYVPVPLPAPRGFGVHAPLPLRGSPLPYVVDGIDWNAVRVEGLELVESDGVSTDAVDYAGMDANEGWEIVGEDHNDTLSSLSERLPGSEGDTHG